MANAPQFSVPAPPTTSEVASVILSYIAAQTNVLTDFSEGSIVRTLAEALGSVVSINAIELQAMAYQAIIYGGFSALNITPLSATPATGAITFYTGASSPYPVATSPIPVAAGTQIQTSTGIIFQTTADATIPTGSSSVTTNISATIAGSNGNVAANTITSMVSPLTTPLYPTNANPTAGGTDQETQQQTASRFANAIASMQLSSPQAVASSVKGVSISTGESVVYSSAYEPWIEQTPPYTPGFEIIIDNGSATTSNALITAVTNFVAGNNATNTQYRPAGVPFTVIAASALDVNITVVANRVSSTQIVSSITGLISNAITSYFSSLGIGATAEIGNLTAQIVAAVSNQVTGMVITMALTSAPSTPVNSVEAAYNQRIIVANTSITVN